MTLHGANLILARLSFKFIQLTALLAASLLGRSLCSVTCPLLAPFAIPDRAMVDRCCVSSW